MARWKSTLVASWLAQICSIIGFGMAIPFLPPYIRELGVRDERAVLLWAGWLSTAAGIVMAVMAPIWGVLADRYGRKLMVLRSMLGGTLVLGLMACVHNVYQLLALRMMQGFLTGTVSASVALVGSVVPTSHAGFALGLMHTAQYIGNSLGPGLGGRLAYAYGMRMAFVYGAGMLFFGALLVALAVHEEFDPEEAQAQSHAGETIRQVLALPGFLALGGLLFLVMFNGSFIGPLLPLYVEQLAGGAPGAATKLTGDILALGAIAAAMAAALLGRLGDRLGYTRVLTACTLLTGLTLIPHALVRNPQQLLLWRLITSFVGAGTIPAINALIRHIVPRHACGQAYGLMQTLSCLGWGIGPLVGSALAAHFGMRATFVVVGLLFVGVAGLVKRLRSVLQQATVLEILRREADGAASEKAACLSDALGEVGWAASSADEVSGSPLGRS